MFSGSIVGRLGKDPELRQTTAGPLCSFTVATDHGFGEKKRTTWTKCVVFGKQAENASKWLFKGGRVACSGDVYLDEWTGREGDKRVTLTMDVRSWENLDRKPEDAPPSRGQRRAEDIEPPWPDDEEIPY